MQDFPVSDHTTIFPAEKFNIAETSLTAVENRYRNCTAKIYLYRVVIYIYLVRDVYFIKIFISSIYLHRDIYFIKISIS